MAVPSLPSGTASGDGSFESEDQDDAEKPSRDNGQMSAAGECHRPVVRTLQM